MRSGLLALLILVTGFWLAKAQDTGASEAHPFSISSLNTPFAIQADFEGEYRIYHDQIVLKLTKADIRIGEHCPYIGRRLLSSIKFGLATSTVGKRWKIADAGPEFFLEKVMRPGDVYSLGERVFCIPINETIDLSKHWLVLLVEDTPLDLAEEANQKGYAFAHSCRDIFTRNEKCVEMPNNRIQMPR